MRPSISPLFLAAPFLAVPAMAQTDSTALREAVTLSAIRAHQIEKRPADGNRLAPIMP